MEDMERYGDYTEYEDDIPKRRTPIMRILKITVAVLCIAVIGVFAFRMFLFNYYPDSVSDIYFTENMTAYYNSVDGQINAKTQKLRSPYDDPDVANFFCDNLIVVEGAGELQLSVRYNNSAIENLKTKLELDSLNPESEKLFSFRLYDNYNRIYEAQIVATDELMMYHYYKLSFDGIPFNTEGVDAPEWMRLEIFVEGQTSEEPTSMVLVYENHDAYSSFEEYKLSGKERPS